MTDIADEFKIVVVEAIRSLCLKFPQKYRALMNFLSSVLREDGGFEYKKAIVDSILILIREIPDAKESGLAHLCEFIEVRSSVGLFGLRRPPNCLDLVKSSLRGLSLPLWGQVVKAQKQILLPLASQAFASSITALFACC